MDTSFEEDFHSLTGITIGERRKNLFLLFGKISKSGITEINFKCLQPRTPLEENFKVEGMIYFKRSAELLEVLKSENPILIEKALNAGSWFIEEAFREISGEELATKIFPQLSYNTKLKLLNKLALQLKNTNKADEYFEAVKEIYGVYLAAKLLPACGDALIMKCIEVNKVEITPKQLLVIIKKYPALTESIFEKLNNYNSKLKVAEKYKYVFSYLIQRDVPLFMKLKDKYNPDIELGARATKTFISKEKSKIVENPKRFYKLLKKEQLGKSIKEDFEDFYLNLFPKSLNKFKENLEWYLSLLDHLPSDPQRLKLLLKTYKAVHGNELWDHPNFVISRLIEMMSPDDREVWMQTHARPDDISEDQWTSYMKTAQSLPLLKEKISFTSNIKERVKLVTFLVTTCKINDDKAALLDICEYMWSKHRNDHSTVRQQFLTTACLNFRLEQLQDEHWKYINDFLKLSKVKGEQSWVNTDIFEKYIQYCFEKNLPVKNLLMEWTKTESRYNICEANPKCEKSCLLEFNEIFPTAYKEKDLKYKYVLYLHSLHDWSRRHPKEKLSLFINSEAINYLKTNLENESYAYAEEELAVTCIHSDLTKAEEANFLEIILKREYGHFGLKVVDWLFKKHPLILLDHIESVTECLLKTYSGSCVTIPLYIYYAHLEIPQKIAEICLNALNTESEEDNQKRKNAATILSYTLSPKEFLNLVVPYYPSDLRADIQSEEGQRNYKKQQVFLPCLRNMIPPSLALETVLQFCKGDYLNLIQRSLYSVSQNTPEDKLVAFFDDLRERAVSVRKHAIFLAFKVLNKSNTYVMLSKFVENETNRSIRKSLFKAIFNFFLRNPDEHAWELVKESVKAVDVNDKEAFNILTKCRRIPLPYFVRYVSFTWDVLEEFQTTNEVIEEGKSRIVESITSTNISMLPKGFCEGIIKKYLFKSEKLSNFQTKVHSLACKYIIYSTSASEREERMGATFHILRYYAKSTWFNVNAAARGRQMVLNFVKEFCSDFLNKKCLAGEVLQHFASLWDDSFKPHEAFDDYLYLQFTLIYLDCLNEKLTITQIGEKVAFLCNALHEKNSLVPSIFYKSLDLFKTHFLLSDPEDDCDDDTNENQLTLAESIVKTSSSPACLILAIYLLPNEVLTVPKMKLMYEGIVEIITKETNPLVQIHFHHYLNNKE